MGEAAEFGSQSFMQAQIDHPDFRHSEPPPGQFTTFNTHMLVTRTHIWSASSVRPSSRRVVPFRNFVVRRNVMSAADREEPKPLSREGSDSRKELLDDYLAGEVVVSAIHTSVRLRGDVSVRSVPLKLTPAIGLTACALTTGRRGGAMAG